MSRILKNNDSVVILKCPNRMSEYYFNKGFIELECDEDQLKKLPLMVKERVGAEVKVNTDFVMLFYTTITSTSNILKNPVINSNYRSSYSTEEFNTKKEQMSNIFSTYITPKIKEINQTAIHQE